MGDGKGVILQNHGLLTVGNTVDEAAYLFTLLEKSCQVNWQHKQHSCLVKIKIIGDEEAAYCERNDGDPETLYTEFQPDFEMEVYLNDDFLK